MRHETSLRRLVLVQSLWVRGAVSNPGGYIIYNAMVLYYCMVGVGKKSYDFMDFHTLKTALQYVSSKKTTWNTLVLL